MNPSTALARVLVDELARGGVADVVLAPGSRSAPLAYALQDAEAAGTLRLHVRVDERSAGFLALGLARGSRRPVAVVTTSGTAVANLHPAVLEARHGGVPLVVLSADRPPELRGTGANQTTDQVGIFGSAVVWSRDLGAPDRRPGQVAGWRATVSRALAAAAGGSAGTTPGPVHLNVPFREPLVPDADGDDGWVEPLDGRANGAPWTETVPAGAPGGGTSATTHPAYEAPERTLLVVGDLGDSGVAAAVAAVSAARGWPVVAEPTSGCAGVAVPHGPLLLASTEWLAAHRPEGVVVVGRPTLSRAVAALLRDPEVAVDVVATGAAAGDWPDPSHVARRVLPVGWLDHQAGPTGIGSAAREGAGDWAAAWCAAGRRVAEALEPVLAAAWPSGPAVARTVLAALPTDATLLLGSSNPVRDVDLAATPRRDLRVIANRGLAGIDGTVSTAAGVALAGGGRPTYALMGDLTFLHDQGGLVVGPDEPRPDLTVVVVNDDGGGIFTLLEQGEPARAAGFERVFGTPHGVDLAALCAATGTAFTRAKDAAELTAALAEEPRGLRVVEVRVERSGHRDLHASLRRVAAEALRHNGS